MEILGIHHVSMTCNQEEYPKVLKFYTEFLGLKIGYDFPKGCLLDTGGGFIEIFNDGTTLPKGTIRHFALEVASADEMIEKSRLNGYKIILEPKDVDLSGLKARVGFILGPIGEEIEFFEVKKNG